MLKFYFILIKKHSIVFIFYSQKICYFGFKKLIMSYLFFKIKLKNNYNVQKMLLYRF